MTKKCVCANGKTCAKCAKHNINLDSFHKLNPEAKPKTAEQFKLAFTASPGLQRAGELGYAALKGSVPGVIGGALAGGILAPEGQRLEGMGRGAALGGLAYGGSSALHHGMMTGTSDLAQRYRGVYGEHLHQRAVKDRAQRMEEKRQLRTNLSRVPPPEAVPAATEPKVSMYYGVGARAAKARFSLE